MTTIMQGVQGMHPFVYPPPYVGEVGELCGNAYTPCITLHPDLGRDASERIGTALPMPLLSELVHACAREAGEPMQANPYRCSEGAGAAILARPAGHSCGIARRRKLTGQETPGDCVLSAYAGATP